MKHENVVKIAIIFFTGISSFISVSVMNNSRKIHAIEELKSGHRSIVNANDISALKTADRYQIKLIEEIHQNVREIRKEVLRK